MIADSSFLIALFLEEDENHDIALKEFDENKGIITILDRVLEEIFTVFTYKKGIAFSIEAVEKILINKRFLIYYFDSGEHKAIFRLIKKVNCRISFIDYCVAYLAIIKNKSLLCYDAEINNIAKKYKQVILKL